MNHRTTYDALLALGAATVYEAQGAKGALDSGIKPIDPGSRLVGPALTVDTRPADNLMLHYALLAKRASTVTSRRETRCISVVPTNSSRASIELTELNVG